MMLIEKYSKCMSIRYENANNSSLQPFAESLLQDISEFHYGTEADRTCLDKLRAYSEMISPKFWIKKVSILLQRLGIAECEWLTGFIHPRTISNLTSTKLFYVEYFELLLRSLSQKHDENWMNYAFVRVHVLSFSIFPPFRKIISNI